MATSSDYSKSITIASDELKEIFCEPCVCDGKQVEAEGFCVDCSEYLCGQCYNSHGRYKSFKHHVLQDKASMPTEAGSTGAFDVCVEKCPKHPTKVIEYFCRPCDTLGCSACITTNHRRCKSVEHIPDFVKDLETNKDLLEFTKNLDKKLRNVEERKKKISSRISDAGEMKKKARVVLKKERNEINKFFDNLEAEMEKEIAEIDQYNKATLKAASTRCNAINDELNKMKIATETKMKNGQKCELFVTMKKSKSITDNLDRQITCLYEESKIQRYQLLRSSQVEEITKHTTEICKLLTAKFVSHINVSTNKDSKPPSIRGLAAVQNHYLAVADGSNKAVKIIEASNGSVTSEMNLVCDVVWNVANVNNDQIAVSVSTFGHHNNIQTMAVSASGMLSKSRVIPIAAGAFDLVGIAQFLYLLDTNKIKVIEVAGDDVTEIGHGTTYHSIAVSPDNETIYLISQENGSVTSMLLDGKVKTTYKDNELKYPMGVAADKEGFVYVRSTGRIHQLTKDCIKIQVLVEDVVGKGICYSRVHNSLYVGQSDKVTVYRLN